VEARALERHLPRTTPLPTQLLVRTWRNTWEKLTGRPGASVGNASVDEVVREPRVAPNNSRQPLLQSRNVLPEPHVVTGNLNYPVTITDLTFLYLVSRGELKWTIDGLPPTEPGLQAGTNLNPLYKPPGAVRLGGTPDGPLNVLWTTVGDVSVRHPPLIVAPALITLSFWASLPLPLNSSRSGSFISDKGIRISQSWSNCLCLHRWSVACECHSPSVLCRWTDPLVVKPHCYRKAGPLLVTCPRIRPPRDCSCALARFEMMAIL
jgi:hypothetical protein